MNLANETRFPCFFFESLGQHDELLNIAVCRGTFEFDFHDCVKESTLQEPVVLTDQYHDDPSSSSVQVESDIVPFKRCADVTLNSIASAPSGIPHSDWNVHLSIGKVAANFRVHGPRQWEYSSLRGWRLADAEPTTEVALKYENSFGGSYHAGDVHHICEHNPVGIGFGNPAIANKRCSIPAPQIEALAAPIGEFGKLYSPVGVGPIAKHWVPRRHFCGKVDEQWLESRWPLRPTDFSFDYYNCAPKALLYPGYLLGGERVCLRGIDSYRDICFDLPCIQLKLFSMDSNDNIRLDQMVLDTLHIDTTKSKASLTWRCSFPKVTDLRVLQITRDS